MRYQSALVLSTLAAGQAAASAVHGHGHSNFHKRREVKRDMADVNWDKVSYDLTSVDWNNVDYGNGASAPAASSPAAQPASSPAAPAQDSPVAQAAAQTSSAAAPSTTSAAASSPSKESSSSDSSSDSSSGGLLGSLVGDLLSGVDSVAKSLGAIVGDNSQTNNGKIWIGDSGANQFITFNNAAGEDTTVWCWDKPAMWVNANKPAITVNVKAGKSVTLAVADKFSGACGPSWTDSILTDGQLDESILEFTFGPSEWKEKPGVFDVSREVNMKGIKLTATGGKCTSGYDASHPSAAADGSLCAFACVNGAQKCGAGGGDYDILGQDAQDGACEVGNDPSTGDRSGGCQMGSNNEHIQVTIHGTRW